MWSLVLTWQKFYESILYIPYFFFQNNIWQQAGSFYRSYETLCWGKESYGMQRKREWKFSSQSVVWTTTFIELFYGKLFSDPNPTADEADRRDFDFKLVFIGDETDQIAQAAPQLLQVMEFICILWYNDGNLFMRNSIRHHFSKKNKIMLHKNQVNIHAAACMLICMLYAYAWKVLPISGLFINWLLI